MPRPVHVHQEIQRRGNQGDACVAPTEGIIMSYNPDIHHRRSVRLRDYDYRSAGTYFLTICAFQRECLFGEVVDGEMQVNQFGEIVREEWQKTDIVRENVILDEFVIMPNHIHGILIHMPSFAFLVITT